MRFMTHILLFLVACCVEKYLLPDISVADIKNFYSRSVVMLKNKQVPVPNFLAVETTQAPQHNYYISSVNTYSDLPEHTN